MWESEQEMARIPHFPCGPFLGRKRQLSLLLAGGRRETPPPPQHPSLRMTQWFAGKLKISMQSSSKLHGVAMWLHMEAFGHGHTYPGGFPSFCAVRHDIMAGWRRAGI